MYVNTTGIVLRETAYRDSSKILTVLTGSQGKLTVSARGALRKNSKLAAVTQLLVFSEMTLFENRDRWTLTEGRTVEQFRGLQADIEKLALGSYFAELIEALADEDSFSPQLLSLCLNALFALSEGLKEARYVKPAFELRLLAVSGFAPLVSHCAICGSTELERAVLDYSAGTLWCISCNPQLGALVQGGVGDGAVLRGPAYNGAALGAGAIQAARYIISCEQKKLFSFSLSDAALDELSFATEGYLLEQLDRRFRTLEFYKDLIGIRN